MEVRPAQGPVQVNPNGAMSLLGLKGQADTPNSIAGFVQPTMDFTQFYLSRAVQISKATVALVDGTNNANLMFGPVPIGETWFIRDFSMILTIGAGGSLQSAGFLRIAPFAAGSFALLDVTEWMDPISGTPSLNLAGRQLYGHAEHGMLLLPGERLGVRYGDYVEAGGNTSQIEGTLCHIPLLL